MASVIEVSQEMDDMLENLKHIRGDNYSLAVHFAMKGISYAKAVGSIATTHIKNEGAYKVSQVLTVTYIDTVMHDMMDMLGIDDATFDEVTADAVRIMNMMHDHVEF